MHHQCTQPGFRAERRMSSMQRYTASMFTQQAARSVWSDPVGGAYRPPSSRPTGPSRRGRAGRATGRRHLFGGGGDLRAPGRRARLERRRLGRPESGPGVPPQQAPRRTRGLGLRRQPARARARAVGGQPDLRPRPDRHFEVCTEPAEQVLGWSGRTMPEMVPDLAAHFAPAEPRAGERST